MNNLMDENNSKKESEEIVKNIFNDLIKDADKEIDECLADLKEIKKEQFKND